MNRCFLTGNRPTKEVIPMTPSTHDDYRKHLKQQFLRYQNDPDFMKTLSKYTDDLVTLTDLSRDHLRDQLAELYCPTGQGKPYDPWCMLRSLRLMTLEHESSPDRRANRLQREPVLAILAGFPPGHTPCATAPRDSMPRVVDGP